ncbi:MAG: oligosaccharide flippase family protein [Bacteroidota bacterium]
MKGGASSAKYILLSSLFSKMVLLVSSIVLARILKVEDFGYLLTLNIIFSFINLFSISGYEFYFIQNRSHEGADELKLLRQVFNLRVLQSTLLFLATNAIGLYIFIYSDKMLAVLLFITSFLFLIGLISKPEETFLSKALDYRTISLSGFARDLTGSISKIAFALLGAGPLTFSLGNVIGNLSFSSIIKFRHNLKLLQKTEIRDSVDAYSTIRKFGFHLFLNTAGGFFTKQVDKIFIASYFSKTEQGIYQFSNNYAGYAFNALIAPQSSMVLSLMAKNKDNQNYLLRLFKHYGIISGLVIAPLVIWVFTMASEIIPLVFGDKWIGAINLFRVFIIYYFIKILLYPTNGILTSFGRPDLKAKVTLYSFAVIVPILGFISYAEFDIIYYGLVFITIASLSDAVCMVLGFRFMGTSVVQFLKERIRIILPFLLLIPLFLWIQQMDLSYLTVLILSFVGTILAIYGMVNLRSEAFLESLSTFIKNDRLLNIVSKFLIKNYF